MKKITLFLIAFFTVALYSNAQVNNPKDAGSHYIVKWDCDKDTWAAANNFEVDETFTFAIDVTGTALETWLKATPSNAGATRSIALNKWTGFGNVSGDSHRLKQIKGNIYGATWNFLQLATDMDISKATEIGAETLVYGTVFGFEYTNDNPGAAWWQGPIDINPGAEDGAIFKTLPYTGTKTSPEFYNDDFGNELFGASYPVKGYAPACAISTSVDNPSISDLPTVGYEYYNLQGAKLVKEPEQGLFIEKALKIDGSFVTKKILKSAK